MALYISATIWALVRCILSLCSIETPMANIASIASLVSGGRQRRRKADARLVCHVNLIL